MQQPAAIADLRFQRVAEGVAQVQQRPPVVRRLLPFVVADHRRLEGAGAQHRLGLQRRVVADAVAIAGGAPVHVGPVTLRPRFNAVATTAPPTPPADLDAGYGPALLDDATDERQDAPQLAAWAIASAAALVDRALERRQPPS